MPIQSQIDIHRRLVTNTGEGLLTGAEILAEQLVLLAHPEFDRRLNQLMDLTHVTGVAISSEEIRLMAERSLFAPESRRAYVVIDALQYGLLRMFNAYTHGNSGELQIFATRRDAERWLGA